MLAGQLSSLNDPPTREGYTLKGWNTKADGTGQDVDVLGSNLTNGQTIYAQWEKDTGKPVSVKLNCNSSSPTYCSVTATYSDKTVKTRQFNPAKDGNLDWNGNPIAGVRLDDQGYLADQSCAIDRCRYVSLAEPPSDTNTRYQAQMPTTGAPEGLSQVGVIAVGLGLIGISIGLMRRRS